MVTVIIQRGGEDVFIELHPREGGVGWTDIAAFLPNGERVELTAEETDIAVDLADSGVDYTGTDE